MFTVYKEATKFRAMSLQSKPTYFITILNLGVVLLFLGMLALVLLHMDRIDDFGKEQQNILVELKNQVSENERYLLKNELVSNTLINSGSVTLIDKNEGLKILEEQLGDAILEGLDENPLSDYYSFNLESGDIEISQIDSLLNEVQQSPFVQNVHFEKSHFNALELMAKRLVWAFSILSLAALVFSVLLIFNTFRMMLYADRKEIFTMQLVGAKNQFIWSPYRKKAASIGLGGFLLACLLLAIFIVFLSNRISNFSGLIDIHNIVFVVIGMLLLGVALSIICSKYIVSAHLREQFQNHNA